MTRWHVNHEYPHYYINQLLDPDFDNLGGELTLAQIRDPIPLEFGDMVDLRRRELARRRDKIHWQQICLDRLANKARREFDLKLWQRWQRLGRVAGRFQQLVQWQVKTRRQPRDRWLREVGAWLPKHMRWLLNKRKTKVTGLAQRLHNWELRSCDRYPTFFFAYNHKCDHCIPYNGHHTPNYWMVVGQKDPW